MKMLEFVTNYDKVDGNVIEYSSGNYRVRRYFHKAAYDYREDYSAEKELSFSEKSDVISRDTLPQRVKRLHHYFRCADYISDSALDLLNFKNEDLEDVLKGIVFFG